MNKWFLDREVIQKVGYKPAYIVGLVAERCGLTMQELSFKDICETLDISPSSCGKLMKKLDESGYIERVMLGFPRTQRIRLNPAIFGDQQDATHSSVDFINTHFTGDDDEQTI